MKQSYFKAKSDKSITNITQDVQQLVKFPEKDHWLNIQSPEGRSSPDIWSCPRIGSLFATEAKAQRWLICRLPFKPDGSRPAEWKPRVFHGRKKLQKQRPVSAEVLSIHMQTSSLFMRASRVLDTKQTGPFENRAQLKPDNSITGLAICIPKWQIFSSEASYPDCKEIDEKVFSPIFFLNTCR